MDVPPLPLDRIVGESAMVFALSFVLVCVLTLYARSRPPSREISPLEETLRLAFATGRSFCLLLAAPIRPAGAVAEAVARLEKILRPGLRKDDFYGSYNGEMIVVVAMTDLAGAARIGTRLSALAESATPIGFGIAQAPKDGAEPMTLLGAAVAGLDRALEQGRTGTGIAPATVRAADAASAPLLSQQDFARELGRCIANRRRANSVVSLLHVGIDQLQKISEQYGRPVADNLVRETSEIIRHEMRKGDPAAEADAGSLVILLPASPSQASEVASRLVSAVRRPILAAKGANAKLTVSIGVASVPQHAGSAAALFDAASIAMNVAKGRGGNAVVLFERDMPVTGRAETPRDVF